jgi:hypothetical protein
MIGLAVSREHGFRRPSMENLQRLARRLKRQRSADQAGHHEKINTVLIYHSIYNIKAIENSFFSGWGSWNNATLIAGLVVGRSDEIALPFLSDTRPDLR